jgi:hypothetical protein
MKIFRSQCGSPNGQLRKCDTSLNFIGSSFLEDDQKTEKNDRNLKDKVKDLED